MRLIILGAPASGKGTQCNWISKEYNIPHISTGEIFRRNIEEETELGLKVKDIIQQGILVPDDIVNQMVFSRLDNNDCKENGFILDGFPRTLVQTDRLNEYLINNNIKIDLVVNLYIPDEELIDRACNRETCSNSECRKMYNKKDNPTKILGICDVCGSPIKVRADDNEKSVLTRIKKYHEQTEPIIDYYKEKKILVTVEGQQEIDDTISLVRNEINKIENKV